MGAKTFAMESLFRIFNDQSYTINLEVRMKGFVSIPNTTTILMS